jgi:hypothetical protein
MRGLVRFGLAAVLLMSLAGPVQAARSKLTIVGPVCDHGVVRVTASSSWAPDKGLRGILQTPNIAGATYHIDGATGPGLVEVRLAVPFIGAGTYGTGIELYRWMSVSERQVEFVTVFATIETCPV